MEKCTFCDRRDYEPDPVAWELTGMFYCEDCGPDAINDLVDEED